MKKEYLGVVLLSFMVGACTNQNERKRQESTSISGVDSNSIVEAVIADTSNMIWIKGGSI